MSYLTGKRQFSPICNIEEGDYDNSRVAIIDGVSPMTYKKLKEMGYTSDDWQNWSDDEKVKKSQEGREEQVKTSNEGSSSDELKSLRSEIRKVNKQYREGFMNKLDDLKNQANQAIKSQYPSTYRWLQKNLSNKEDLLFQAGSRETDDPEWRKERPLLSLTENESGHRLEHMFGRLAYHYQDRTGQTVLPFIVDMTEQQLNQMSDYKQSVAGLNKFLKSPEYKVYKNIVNATGDLGDAWKETYDSKEMQNLLRRSMDLSFKLRRAKANAKE